MARRTRLWDLIAIFVASVRPSLFLASPAAAHPHVWVTVHSEILLNPDRQITGIRHAWTFDEFYSTMAVQGLNTNGDGVLSADELKFYRDAGANRLVLFSQRDAVASANGQALEIVRRIAPTLDHTQHL